MDGVLTVRGDQAAAVRGAGAARVAEPRVMVWELDFAAAERFGAPHASGLAVQDPGKGGVVINQNLADRLGADTGDRLTFYLYGAPVEAEVSAIVHAKGLGGVGTGGSVNENAFVTNGTLTAAARAAGREPTTTTFVSNRGGVEDAEPRTPKVTAAIRSALGPLTTQGAAPPRHVVRADA